MLWKSSSTKISYKNVLNSFVAMVTYNEADIASFVTTVTTMHWYDLLPSLKIQKILLLTQNCNKKQTNVNTNIEIIGFIANLC